MATEFSCPKCGRANWKSYFAMLGHSGRCRGIPGLLERVAAVQAAPATPAPNASLNGPQNGSLNGSGSAVPTAPSGGFSPPPYAPPPLDFSTAQLLEARISVLENENRVLKEIVTNDLAHLGAQQQASTNLLPWLVVGGVVLLVAVTIFSSSEDVAPERAALGDAGRRPPSLGGAILGKVLDRATTKLVDRAIGKLI